MRRSWGSEFSVYTGLNVDATQRLLEACVKKPIERLVYASSSSVYGDDVAIPMVETALPQPVSPYGVTKLAAEQLCHLYFVNFGVPCVSLRYFTVYGPRQRPDMGFNRFFTAILKGQPLVQFGDGLQTRDFTYVADAAKATADAAVRGVPGRVYNIGGGARVSLREVFDLLARVSGRKVTIDQQGPQKGDMRDTYADTSRARPLVSPVGDARRRTSADVALDGSPSISDFGSSGLRIWGGSWVVLARAGWLRRQDQALPPGTADADKFVRPRDGSGEGQEGLDAREYFRNIVDNYPQSTYGPDAKLALGDTYISQGARRIFLAANEFRFDVLPTHQR